MSKKILMFKLCAIIICFSNNILSAAENNVIAWESRVSLIKQEVTKKLKQGDFPYYVSETIRSKENAQSMSLNVSGQKQLILRSWETLDGMASDHSVWANARLTTKNGKTVWLSDLKGKIEQVGYASVFRNSGPDNSKLSIGEKQYTKGFFVHAPSLLVFDLDKKYVKFESEIGVNNTGAIGSVIFSAMCESVANIEATLKSDYAEDFNEFVKLIKVPFFQWILTNDASIEKQAAEQALTKLKNKTYYQKQIDNIAKLTTINEQIESYLSLIKQISRIEKIDNQFSWVNVSALQEAYKDMSKQKGFDIEKNKELLDYIVSNYTRVKEQLYTGDEEAVNAAYKIIKAKRSLLMANPLLDMDQILIGRYKLGNRATSAMGPQLGTQIQNYNSQPSAPRTGFDAEISLLSNLREDVQITTIFEPKNSTSIADIHLHWNADKLMFTMSDDAEKWNVFEIGIDGSGLKKVIDIPEKELDFCDAAYLPDGRILATSTIGYHGVPCISGFDEVCNLVLYNPENKDFRRLTFDQDGNWNPTIMNNGRVLYTRWEYADLTHYFSRIVMHMNPDGTENRALYGSSSFWPNSTYDMKNLPNSTNKFIGIVTGHHGIVRSGRLVIFDPSKSRKEAEGVVQELPFKDRVVIPEIKDYLVDGVWPQFTKPSILNENYFLVSAKLSPTGLWGVYLVDVYDNLTLVAEVPGEGFIYPIPVTKRPIPPVIPDRVNLEDKEATIFIQDIYEGEGLRGVPRGTVKELRLYAFEYGYMDSPTEHYAQGIQAGWDIKRLLGTVPVEKDGSAIFKVPANLPISFQPLDSLGRAVQWMRSWVTSMPGETVSCIGCHENQNLIPIPKRTIASQIKPHKIVPPEGGVRSITFDLEVQPILDRACISCHNENADLNFVKGNLVEAPTDWTGFKKYFGNSYLAFHPYFYRQGPEADMYVLEPYEYHVSNSELIRMLQKGHKNVELTDKEWLSLYRWVDMNTPYWGSYEQVVKRDGYDQYERRIELADKYNNKAGVDWRKEISDYSEKLAKQGKITPVMPKPVKKNNYKLPKVKNWPMADNEHKIERKVVEIAPNIKMTFVKIPAGNFIMGCNEGENDHSPAFKTSVKKSFWIAESEITNEQYKALFPKHDSRFIGQFWKDHTNPGYPANLPTQPVIRVSWQEAMQYCETLSAKTGLTITLPTETQWEWVARCGSDAPFWYGGTDSDFSKYENLADESLTKMAVIGVDPQPMAKTNPWYKFYNYLPKNENVNDKSMLLTHVKSYQHNPWGVYDMHGNVAEWTRSDYKTYPLNKKSKTIVDEKVVRGGSWIDRPKFSTASSRKSFLPWQKVYNVGIRLIIEE